MKKNELEKQQEFDFIKILSKIEPYKLQYFLERVSRLEPEQASIFYASLYSTQEKDIDTLINLTFNTGCFIVAENIDSVARHWNIGLIEFETPFGGYIQYNDIKQIYDGKTLPYYEKNDKPISYKLEYSGKTAYVYFPLYTDEVKYALEQVGAENLYECNLTKIRSPLNLNEIDNTKGIEYPLFKFYENYLKQSADDQKNISTIINELNPNYIQQLNSILSEYQNKQLGINEVSNKITCNDKNILLVSGAIVYTGENPSVLNLLKTRFELYEVQENFKIELDGIFSSEFGDVSKKWLEFAMELSKNIETKPQEMLNEFLENFKYISSKFKKDISLQTYELISRYDTALLSNELVEATMFIENGTLAEDINELSSNGMFECGWMSHQNNRLENIAIYSLIEKGKETVYAAIHCDKADLRKPLMVAKEYANTASSSINDAFQKMNSDYSFDSRIGRCYLMFEKMIAERSNMINANFRNNAVICALVSYNADTNAIDITHNSQCMEQEVEKTPNWGQEMK